MPAVLQRPARGGDQHGLTSGDVTLGSEEIQATADIKTEDRGGNQGNISPIYK